MRRFWVVALLIVGLLAGCGDDDGKIVEGGDATEEQTTEQSEPPETEAVLPPGGSVPKLESAGLEEAARAAGCELKSFRAKSREHTSDLDEEIDYSSAPPTSGKHFEAPAEDAAYLEAPDVKTLVHALEHGRVVIWFKGDLQRGARANLRAFYEDDPFQTLLTPDATGSDYAVSATAWNRKPVPNGTGNLLGCEAYTPRVFAALKAFKDEHRGKGPEAIP